MSADHLIVFTMQHNPMNKVDCSSSFRPPRSVSHPRDPILGEYSLIIQQRESTSGIIVLDRLNVERIGNSRSGEVSDEVD